MNFNLKKPCAQCPFRTDVTPYITSERAAEICHSLVNGASFPCHKTTKHSEEEDSDMVCTPKSEMCAGAMILLEKIERPNQMMRIGERIGMYDHRKLDMSQPVYDSPEAMIKAHKKKGRKK